MGQTKDRILIKAKNLKDVQKSFQKIRQTSVLPILNFIKIDVADGWARITKNNLEVFLEYKIPSDGKGSVLVQESVLWNVVSFSAPEEVVDIFWDEKNYTVSSGEMKIKNQVENILTYPTHQEPNSDDGVLVNIDEISHLSGIIKDEEIKTEASYVFVGNGKAAGSDRFIGHCVDFSGNIKMALRREVLSTLPPEEMRVKQSDNYDFFISENYIYGFSKSEINFFDISKFFVIPESIGFMFQKKDLLKFVDLAISSSTSKINNVTLSVKDRKMYLKTHDEISGNTVTYSIGVDSPTDFPEVVFVSEQLSKLLKAVKYEEITMIPDKNKSYIKLPDGSVGLIMQVFDKK
jgi:hypothetical protein